MPFDVSLRVARHFDDDDAVAVNDDEDSVVDGQRDAMLGGLTRLSPR
jgi:hypothetical protein